jgi:hypothetical protein
MATAGIRVLEERRGDGAGIQCQRSHRPRKPKISSHLTYGARGIPGKIPPGSLINAEIEIIAERDTGDPDE